MTNSDVHLAIIGCGRFAKRRILPALADCSGVRLGATVGGTPPDDAGAPHFSGLEQFLATEPSGIAYIASPNALHAPHAIACLEAGLHVLCEKPMANSNHECAQMLASAKQTRRRLQVGHMLRFSPGLQRVRELIHSDTIGLVPQCRIVFHYELAGRPWSGDRELAGGGVLLDAGIHCLDALRWIFGSVRATTCTLDEQNDNGIERRAHADVHCANTHAVLDLSSAAPYRTDLLFQGTRGRMRVENFATTWGEIVVTVWDADRRQVLMEAVDCADVYLNQLRHFVNAVVSNDLAIAWAEEAMGNVAVVEELYRLSQ